MPNNTKYKYTFYCLDVGYIGSTREQINKRLNNHRYSCYFPNSTGYNSPVYKHIRKHYPGYNFAGHNVVILDVVSGLTEAQAHAVEQQFIDQLKPEFNSHSANQELTNTEYNLQKIECPCGVKICRGFKAKHMRSKKHKEKIKEMESLLNQYYKTSEDKHVTTLKHETKFK